MEQYLSVSQAAYRPKRSTSDILWVHRFIIAKVQLYQDLKVYITVIDMSSAFDTINRQKIMNEFNTFLDEALRKKCPNEELFLVRIFLYSVRIQENELNTLLYDIHFTQWSECRTIRTLLSNTSINIQFADYKGEEIETNIGSPQGDAISGTFFNKTFEESLRNLREKMNKIRPEIEHSYDKTTNPLKEFISADDSNFPTLSKAERENLKSIMKETLAEEDLIVNEENTKKL